MEKPNTERKFQERLIDSFERSRIRQEVLRTNTKRLSALKRRYASMVLGASLAVGSIGIPLKSTRAFERPAERDRDGSSFTQQLSQDVAAAQKIAREVTGGVSDAAAAVSVPLASAPKETFHLVTEKAKEDFFKSEVPFGQIIYREAKKNDLDPELVAAVVETESRFKPRARSGANAQGLMQLVPRTGRWMGAKNLMDPVQNVKAGTKYLKYLNERFDGDQKKVLAAYNAGEGNVRRFGGIPPFRETQNYVRKVLNAKEDYQDRVSGKVAESLEEITSSAAGDTEETQTR